VGWGAVRCGPVWLGSYGYARRGKARLGKAGLGGVWQGKVLKQKKLKRGINMKITKEYSPTKHADFGIEKAQIYGQHLDSLQAESGVLTPATVISDAKDKDSPIHSYFEWDNKKAGNKHRLHQARSLMNSILVKIVYPDNSESKIRKFHNITIEYSKEEKKSERGYVSVDVVVQSRELTAQVVEFARSELAAWSNRYRQYEKLQSFIDIVDNITISLKSFNNNKSPRLSSNDFSRPRQTA